MAGEKPAWVNKGYSTVSPYIVAKGAQKVIDFASEVLNAEVLHKMMNEKTGGVMHCSMRIGECCIMACDGCTEDPKYGASTAWLYVYVQDVDATVKLGLSKEGVTLFREIKDEFYGDRVGALKDPSGNVWWIATHKFEPTMPGKEAMS